ncbi:MAG TPA: DNA topoisomerase [Gammaproteobacteria bacterium]|nr:DNA topoisomerase [Gammaproteobacteria bacterium]
MVRATAAALMRLYLVQRTGAAAALAQCLPDTQKCRGHYQGPGTLIVPLGGPLLQLARPAQYGAHYAQWRLADLPILPPQSLTIPMPGAEKRLAQIASLLELATEVVHAGDPDREGQLAVDEVLTHLGNTRPVQRLLLADLTPAALMNAMERLQPNAEFEGLRRAAELRRWADWVLGTNLTRAVTLMARRSGFTGVLSVGRVKGVILGLVVRRERERRTWQAQTLHHLTLTLAHGAGTFTARWSESKGRRLDAGAVRRVRARAARAPGTVSRCEVRALRQPPPLPLSLGALQALAHRVHGYCPEAVMKAADALYRAGLITWPRTAYRHLPERTHREAGATLHAVADNLAELAGAVAQADLAVAGRAFNDARWVIHHGMIPTRARLQTAQLPLIQCQLYALICRVFTAQFHPDADVLHIHLEVAVANERFAADGRQPGQPGWRALFAHHCPAALAEWDDDPNAEPLAALPVGTLVSVRDAAHTTGQTQPAPRYTQRSLMGALADLGREVCDARLQAALKAAHGVGTDTTQARILQQLLDQGALATDADGGLWPTAAGAALHDALPAIITRPELHAAWEIMWQSVVRGTGDIPSFLAQLEGVVRVAIDHVRRQRFAPAPGAQPCPYCGGGVLVPRNSPKSGPFWGCSTYPECKARYDDHDGQPRPVERDGRGRSGRRGISRTI